MHGRMRVRVGWQVAVKVAHTAHRLNGGLKELLLREGELAALTRARHANAVVFYGLVHMDGCVRLLLPERGHVWYDVCIFGQTLQHHHVAGVRTFGCGPQLLTPALCLSAPFFFFLPTLAFVLKVWRLRAWSGGRDRVLPLRVAGDVDEGRWPLLERKAPRRSAGTCCLPLQRFPPPHIAHTNTRTHHSHPRVSKQANLGGGTPPTATVATAKNPQRRRRRRQQRQ
jgi:hypothetical protein